MTWQPSLIHAGGGSAPRDRCKWQGARGRPDQRFRRVARIQPAEQPDVLAALQGKGKAPSSKVTAERADVPRVLTAKPETALVEAVKLMMSPKRKWLVVVDEKNHPLGLVDRHILLAGNVLG